MEYLAQRMVLLHAPLPSPIPRSGEGIKQISQNVYLLTSEKFSINPVCCEISAPLRTADRHFEQDKVNF